MELSSLPMIELHLHLDGAIPPETMWDLANAQGLPLPAATLDDFRRWLARTSDCADVNTYLARFELPLQLMQTEGKHCSRDKGRFICTRPAGTHLR